MGEAAVFEGAAEVDFMGRGEGGEGSGEVGGEGVGEPDGGRGEEAGEDFAFIAPQYSYAGSLFSGIFEELFGYCGLYFEYGVDGLDGDVIAGGVGEEGRG